MTTRIFHLALVPLCAMLFQFCDEPSHIVSPREYVEPPVIIPQGIQLAVGNSYHWRYTRISSYGNIVQWDETYNVVHDTTVDSQRYYVLSTGEILKNEGDSVLAFAQGSAAVYLRFNVAAGQAVPFQGYVLTVASVDTDSVFSETQKVITVSSQALSPAGMDHGRYSTKFGLLEINRSEPTYVTRGVLVGARVGAANYGY